MLVDKINSIVENYKSKQGYYNDFANRIQSIIEEILNLKGFDQLSIEARAKSIQSLERKLEKIQINNLEEVQDLVGVRIVVYVTEDIEKVEKIIIENFEARKLKVDERLGTDKVGYRSHHWIISLSENRLKLPEYQRFTGVSAELQIRTILQHAWAQIGHKQVYKPSAVLPEKIKRNFSLLSGLLEIADNEFNRISNEIINYKREVEDKTKKGNLNIAIDTISLRQYFDDRFGEYKKNVEKKFGPKDDMAETMIEEFNKMGITTIAELDKIVPTDFVENLIKFDKQTNYCGISRNLLIIYDKDKYLKDVWGKKWIFTPDDEGLLYKQYGVDIEELKEFMEAEKKLNVIVQ